MSNKNTKIETRAELIDILTKKDINKSLLTSLTKTT